MNTGIGNDEAAQWMLCMWQAVSEHIADETLRGALEKSPNDLALHMCNRSGALTA